MRPSPTSSRPRPLQTAWELWLVRQLSRLGLRLAPHLVVAAVLAVVGGVALLLSAAIRAWGHAAVDNVRAGPGFFGSEPPGLTNATHLVFLACIPLILLTLTAAVEAAGLRSTEPSIMRADRAVWTTLALEARHVLLTHVAFPRIPLALLALTPPLVVGTLSNLTSAERLLVVVLVGTGITVELVRLLAVTWRLTVPLRDDGRVLVRAVAGLAGAVVIGAGAGMVLRATVPMLARRADDTAPAAAVARFLTAHPVPVLTALAVATAASVLATLRLSGGGRSFPVSTTPTPGNVTSGRGRWSAPVAGPGQLAGAWAAPEARTVALVATALLVARPSLTGLAAQIAPVIAVTTMMAFCVTRVAPWGLVTSLARLRHHVELGARPSRHSTHLVSLALVAVLPVAVPLALVVAMVDGGPGRAVLLVLLPVTAYVLADAYVAQPGARLTERRLLILALAQSVLTICGWFLTAAHPAAGWAAVLLMMGVHRWLSTRRQLIWQPRTRW